MSAPTALLAAGNGAVYVAGQVPNGRLETGALAALARNPASGVLTELRGTRGCVNGTGSQGCAAVPCLGTEATLALSHNGAYVYAGSSNSLDMESTAPGMVGTFARSVAGGLTFIGCAQRPEAISDLLPEPARSSVLVSTAFGDRGTGVASASLDLYRPVPSGELMPERELVCAGYRCPIQFGPEPARLAITPDGATAYYSGFPDGIAVLRAGSGSLVPLPGRWGCIVRRRPFAPWPHCVRAGQPIGSDMSVSPDGRNLYVATSGTGRNGLAFSGGIEAFKIQR